MGNTFSFDFDHYGYQMLSYERGLNLAFRDPYRSVRIQGDLEASLGRDWGPLLDRCLQIVEEETGDRVAMVDAQWLRCTNRGVLFWVLRTTSPERVETFSKLTRNTLRDYLKIGNVRTARSAARAARREPNLAARAVEAIRGLDALVQVLADVGNDAERAHARLVALIEKKYVSDQQASEESSDMMDSIVASVSAGLVKPDQARL